MEGRFFRSLLFFLRAGPWLVAFLALLFSACIPPPDLTCALCPCGAEDSGFVCVASVQRCARKGEEASLQTRCALPQKEGLSGEGRPEGEPLSDTERRPEDAGPSEETTAEPRPESLPEPPPDACQTACPRITRLEGEGTVAAPVYPSGTTAPQGAVEAKARFRETWVVEGEYLDRLARLTLVDAADPTKIFEMEWEGQTSMTKRTVRVPKTLVAGMFLLVGFVGTTSVALGQTFVLQGEKGEGFDSSTLAFVNLLKGFFGKSTSAKLAAEAPTLELKAGDASVSLDAATRTLLCQGANVQITNGDTAKNTYKANGFGNLLLGYNAPPGTPLRSGSHNLVVGDKHHYPASGGFVAGFNNTIEGEASSVLGGEGNQTYGLRSVIAGGYANQTGLQTDANFASYAAILGGSENAAYAGKSSIAGGQKNKTGSDIDASKGAHASVAGGSSNAASGAHASVAGGEANKSYADHSSILGGKNNSIGNASKPTEAAYASIGGGERIHVFQKDTMNTGEFSYVCGGGSPSSSKTFSKKHGVCCTTGEDSCP